MFGVSAAPIEASSPSQVSDFVEDLVLPALVAFDVNMNSSELVLSFSEPMRLNTFSSNNNIILRESRGAGNTVTLSGDDGVSSKDSLVFVVLLTHADMEAIKVFQPLFSSAATSMISLERAFARDMRGNMVKRLDQSSALGSSGFVQDKVAPRLSNFAASLNDGTLVLNFDEPVDASTLKIVSGRLTLQGNQQGSGSHSLVLRGGGNVNSDGPQLTIKLLPKDLNMLKKHDSLFTSRDDSFISFGSALVTDMNNNTIAPVLPGAARQASLFQNDTTSPVLRSFDVNMDTDPGTITLHFAETVRVSSLNVSKMTMQTRFDSMSLANRSYALTGGNVTTTLDNTSVTIEFSKTDFDNLKLKSFGRSNSSTWLTLEKGTIMDMAGTPSSPLVDGITSKKVRALTLDKTKPELASFDVNMNDGTIDVYYNEPVDASSFKASKFTLQNKRNP
jgi:hypothetical protein